jgi:cytochrome c oxidase subunit II
MKFGQTARAAGHALKACGLALALFAVPQSAIAAPAAAVAPPTKEVTAVPMADGAVAATAAATPAATPAAPAPVATVVIPNDPRFKVALGGYTPMQPTTGKGMPVPGGMDVQEQYSPIGQHARPFHTALLWIAVIIAAFVLLLLLYVMFRFRASANPVPSKTSHNTLIEVIWTLVPVLILVAIAVPSIDLLAKQFKPAPAKALTIKATGNQWFWTYSYPDNGGFEVISNMLPKDEADNRGEPEQLGADFRMVVPVGEPIRMQVTAADVIHAFAVPSLWFKIDAVPGRINELVMFVKEPGVYYGQCSELCGARHGYMPIAIEALPRDKYNAWVLTQSGGKLDGLPEAPAAQGPVPAPVPAVAATNEPAPAAAASAASAAATAAPAN